MTPSEQTKRAENGLFDTEHQSLAHGSQLFRQVSTYLRFKEIGRWNWSRTPILLAPTWTICFTRNAGSVPG